MKLTSDLLAEMIECFKWRPSWKSVCFFEEEEEDSGDFDPSTFREAGVVTVLLEDQDFQFFLKLFHHIMPLLCQVPEERRGALLLLTVYGPRLYQEHLSSWVIWKQSWQIHQGGLLDYQVEMMFIAEDGVDILLLLHIEKESLLLWVNRMVVNTEATNNVPSLGACANLHLTFTSPDILCSGHYSYPLHLSLTTLKKSSCFFISFSKDVQSV